MLTWRFADHLNRLLVELVGLVIYKTRVAYLKSFPCIVVKKDISSHLRTCKFSDPENEVDLICLRGGIFDDFIICPTHRWSRGSNSGCEVPTEVSGHFKGRVKSIPKADREIGKRVLQIVPKMSGKFIQPGSGK